MGLISWLASKLDGAPIKASGEGWAADTVLIEMYTEACYRKMALWTAVDLIAKSISKCEFKTLEKGKEVKKYDWYRWNVEPNKNQNSSAFLHKLISQLFFAGECLVVGQNDQLLVADSFNRTPYALYSDVFKNVTVGDFTFTKDFSGAEVFYWNLSTLPNGENIQTVLAGVNASYAKLLAYGMKAYQNSRGTKAIFKYDSLPPHVKTEEANDWLVSQIKKFGTFVASDGGVVTIGNGTSLEAFDRKATYSNETSRDIRNMVDDISDFTAKAIGIHPALIRGDVQNVESAVDYTLTFCLDPLADMIREEIVRKSIGRTRVLQGDDLIIDTAQVKHIDVMSQAGNIDKLIGSGVFCVNDILVMLGKPIISEPWAFEHVLTKNYMPFEEALKPGGTNL